jgi:hypothetical protein
MPLPRDVSERVERRVDCGARHRGGVRGLLYGLHCSLLRRGGGEGTGLAVADERFRAKFAQILDCGVSLRVGSVKVL